MKLVLHDLKQFIDWLVPLLVALGVGNYGRTAVRAWRTRKSSAARRVEDATVDDQIKSTSIVTIEAQHVATARAWDAERASLQGTAARYKQLWEEEREYSGSRDRLVEELRARLDELQAQLDGVRETLASFEHTKSPEG